MYLEILLLFFFFANYGDSSQEITHQQKNLRQQIYAACEIPRLFHDYLEFS